MTVEVLDEGTVPHLSYLCCTSDKASGSSTFMLKACIGLSGWSQSKVPLVGFSVTCVSLSVSFLVSNEFLFYKSVPNIKAQNVNYLWLFKRGNAWKIQVKSGWALNSRKDEQCETYVYSWCFHLWQSTGGKWWLISWSFIMGSSPRFRWYNPSQAYTAKHVSYPQRSPVYGNRNNGHWTPSKDETADDETQNKGHSLRAHGNDHKCQHQGRLESKNRKTRKIHQPRWNGIQQIQTNL